MDELLLPQRLLVKKKNQPLPVSTSERANGTGSTSSVMKLRNKIQSSKTRPLSSLEKAELGNKYIQNYSDEKYQQNSEIISPRIPFDVLILERKLLMEEFLPTIELISLALANKRLYSFYKSLKFDCVIKLHHVAMIIRAERGFGIYDGCNIIIGDGTLPLPGLSQDIPFPPPPSPLFSFLIRR
jgi:hypothetical protein